MFKQLKKRFFALIQLSQYKFILTTYLPGHGHPKVTLLLDQKFSVEFPTTEGITRSYWNGIILARNKSRREL